MQKNVFLIGKPNDFMNLVFVGSKKDFNKFPEAVQDSITEVSANEFKVESLKHPKGNIISYGNYIAWQKVDTSKLTLEEQSCVPHGFDLWCNPDARKHLIDGLFEEVDGKFRIAIIAPVKASFIYNSSIPACFDGKTLFNGQFQVSLTQAKFATPNGFKSCKFREGFAICYGNFPENCENKLFRGYANGTILNVNSSDFKKYYHVDEHGIPIETLENLYKRLVTAF